MKKQKIIISDTCKYCGKVMKIRERIQKYCFRCTNLRWDIKCSKGNKKKEILRKYYYGPKFEAKMKIEIIYRGNEINKTKLSNALRNTRKYLDKSSLDHEFITNKFLYYYYGEEYDENKVQYL